MVNAIMMGSNHEFPNDSADSDACWQPWEVNEDLFDCLRTYYRDVQMDNIKTYDIVEGCESDLSRLISMLLGTTAVSMRYPT